MTRALVLALLLVFAAGCGGGDEGGSRGATADARGAVEGPLAQYRGRPLVVNVWASW